MQMSMQMHIQLSIIIIFSMPICLSKNIYPNIFLSYSFINQYKYDHYQERYTSVFTVIRAISALSPL